MTALAPARVGWRTRLGQPGRRAAGIAAGLGAATIWGGMYVVSKIVLDYVPPITLVLLRLVVGTAALAIIAVATHAPWVRRRDLPQMALLGLIGLCISMIAQFSGTRLSTAANGALITSATPAFMLLFAWPLLGERPTRARILGLLLATAGVTVTIVLDPSTQQPAGTGVSMLLGNLLLVVAAVTWALYSVLSGRAGRRYPALITTGYATFFGAVFTAPFVPGELAAAPIGPLPALVWPGILYLGVVSTAGAFYLWNKSITLLGTAIPSVLFFAQPVVGGLLGAALLGERLGPPFFAGGALVALAVLVTAREA